MNDKGFVNAIELIIVAMTLFIAMSVLFPGLSYKSKWDQAYLLITGKDAILAMDRMNLLYNYSFNRTAIETFLNESISSVNILHWSQTEGTFKNRIIIGCNCTENQISNLISWFGSIRLNNRDIQPVICYTSLDKINPCNDPEDLTHTIDVLLIWGYKNLTPYQTELQNFLNKGNGIIEMADINNTYPGGGPGMILGGITQAKIFGICDASTGFIIQYKYDQFYRTPTNSTDIIYGPYKYFYHIPIPINTSINTIPSIPVEGLPQPLCTTFTEGKFILNQTSYSLWDCDGTSVYFDTDANGTADKRIYTYDNFKIKNYNFSLRYIDGLNRIGISFTPNYLFGDFLGPNSNGFYVGPCGDTGKVLMVASTGGSEPNVSVVILNSSISNVAWLADFSDNGYSDDEKLLLLSLLMWGSNKRAVSVLSPNLEIGYSASYINTANQDMFEVYRLNLGLGQPYK